MKECRESEISGTQRGSIDIRADRQTEVTGGAGGSAGYDLVVLLPCSGLCWPWAAMSAWQMRRQRTT